MRNENDFFMPSEIFEIPNSKYQAEIVTVEESADIFDEGRDITPKTVPGSSLKYIPWGYDDKLPHEVIRLIGRDEVMSQNKLFNVLTCYGAGLQYVDYETEKKTNDPEIRRWMIRNSLPSFFLEQATDMKYFFFCVSVIILSADGTKIVQLRHKEACYCRFEQAGDDGKIRKVFYANWRKSPQKKDIETIVLLDRIDPIGELNILMGKEPGRDGNTKVRTSERKFAIVCRFPTPSSTYYPVPYYTSIFRGDWYDIKRLIGIGKKNKLRNKASIVYQIEVHADYWKNICIEEEITDPIKKKERIKKEKENIKKFVTGIENSGKVWITGYYIDPNGKEQRMVRILPIDIGKEGGDWSEDIQEASNTACYADNIHPNLVGATPGKSQSNNSGSDKRELFTLKQSLEAAFHDIMAIPHLLVIEYNGWGKKVFPDVPIIKLTTLDQNTDAKKVSLNTEREEEA